MLNDVLIRPMQPSDDKKRVAQLIFETSEDLFRAMFGKKDNALPKIEALIALEQNIFSHKYIWIAENDKDIAGILVGYDINIANKMKIREDIRSTLSFSNRLRFWLVLGFSNHILDFEGIEGFYIQNVCVAAASRGKGIGCQLLEGCIETQKNNGVEKIYLDVEADNVIALNLYEKVGFEVFREKKQKIAGVTLYRMLKVVNK